MKKFKKMIALLAAMVMALAMGITVFAADPTYSITVTNTNDTISIAGKTYSAYKLFDMTYNSDKTAYSYSIDSDGDGAWAWSTLTSGLTAGTDGSYTNSTYGMKFVPSAADASVYSVQLVDTNGKYPGETGYNSASLVFTEANARTLADELEKVKPSTANGSATVAAGAETCTINTSPNAAGYYMVYGTAASADPNTTDDEVVAAVALTSTDPTATVNPKAGIPTLDKKIFAVTEPGTTTEVDGAVKANGQAAVAKVGSTVSYQIDSITPDLTGYDDYTFTIGDSISAGLTYDKTSFELKINSSVVSIAPVFATGDKSFSLTIPYDTLKNYTAGTAIVLTYDCSVNDSAITYDYENNTANLEYSRTPYDDETNHTPDKKTYVIDLNIDVDKVAENASGKKLDGATFKLYKLGGTGGTTKLYYQKGTDTINWVANQDDGDDFTTDTAGKLTTQIQGLDQGTYYLEETVAPEGYNILSDPVVVTITATVDGSATVDSTTATYTATVDGAPAAVTNGTVDLTTAQTSAQPVAVATIVNNAGSILPSTGGIGTTIFYLIGTILVIGAGILLVTRRRMNAN